MGAKTARPDLAAFVAWCEASAEAAGAVMLAQAFAASERARVDAYVEPIFLRYGFRAADKWGGQALTRASDLYLSDDEPQVAAFFAECDAAHRANGFIGHPDGHCPALVAENLAREAERLFLALAGDLFGWEADALYGDTRARALRLLLGGCVKTGKVSAAGVLGRFREGGRS